MQIHVISNTEIQQKFSHYDLAVMAAEGSADVFQYREKKFDDKLHLEELFQISEYLKNTKTRLIINDDVNLAKRVGADGVHLGQEDEPLSKVFSENHKLIIGATVHNLQELRAIQYPVDYIGVGAVFGTNSKKMKIPPLGIPGLKKIVTLSKFPVIAIGNIQEHNVQQLLQTNVRGIAILSAFVADPNPVSALQRIKTLCSISCS